MLAALAEVFGEDVGEVRLAAYVEALDDLSLEALREAFRRAVRELTWFPKPVELRRLTHEYAGRWHERCAHMPRCNSPNWCAVMRDKDAQCALNRAREERG